MHSASGLPTHIHIHKLSNMRLTDISQAWLKESLQQGDIVVDATLGNGFDALFLAQRIGEAGQLYGFDVQPQAITQSEILLADETCFKSFFLKGHEFMASVLPPEAKGQIKGIMFNLGWLPNSDKSIITKPDTTISAIKQGIDWLAEGGKLSLMVYPGHQGGDTEAKLVIDWVKSCCLKSKGALKCEIVDVPNHPTAPVLLKISKYA